MATTTFNNGLSFENSLRFVETLTVEQVKNKEGLATISVKQNPKTGKLFMVLGGKTGGVSSKIKSLKDINKPMISLVETPEGEEFYLLHNEGTGGAPTLFSF